MSLASKAQGQDGSFLKREWECKAQGQVLLYFTASAVSGRFRLLLRLLPLLPVAFCYTLSAYEYLASPDILAHLASMPYQNFGLGGRFRTNSKQPTSTGRNPLCRNRRGFRSHKKTVPIILPTPTVPGEFMRKGGVQDVWGRAVHQHADMH